MNIVMMIGVNLKERKFVRYICSKIASGNTGFLTEKTRDSIRNLYRLIAERIRQYQNTTSYDPFSND